MKLQHKFLLILLVFSLLPLTVVTVVSRSGTGRLGREIVADSRSSMTRVAERVLQMSAERAAAAIGGISRAMELSLLVLAVRAERTLTEDHPLPETVRWADDPAGRWPEDSPALGFYLAPGARREHTTAHLGRLAQLEPLMGRIFDEFGGALKRVYVTLEAGLHAAYPGHGDYPAGYEPRRRPWYMEARRSSYRPESMVWSPPMVDAPTGEVIFTLSRHLKRPDGSLAGVAAMDIGISRALQEEMLSRLWSESTRSFIVYTAAGREDREDGLAVLAQRAYQQQAQSWQEEIRTSRLTSADRAIFRQMVDDLSAGRSGRRAMLHEGIPALWGYAPITGETAFIAVVPRQVVTRLAERQTGSIFEYLDRFTWITALTAIGAVVLLTLASVHGSRRAARTFLDLSEAARRLADGDFTVRVRPETGDERDDLARAFNEMAVGLRDREFIRETFGKYVAREIRDEVLAGRVSLDGETKDVSILFSDLRGFTTMTEAGKPTEVVRIVNRYFEEMAAAVQEQGGLVLQFVGDQVYAVFGAPVERSDHPARAFRAGRAMCRRLEALNRRFLAEGRRPLRHGIGIHTGTALAASMGSPDRLAYLLVGDTINLASRLQELNKKADSEMIVSSATWQRLPAGDRDGVTADRLPDVEIRGRRRAVEAYVLYRRDTDDLAPGGPDRV